MHSKKPAILVAEDSKADCELLKRAFQKANVSVRLNIVMDGQEAIDYLSGEADYGDRTENPFPCAILLDLKMPRMNGFDVLAWLRGQPSLKRLPVIVLTSSDEPRDINRAYDLGANSYLLKPTQSEKLDDMARQLQSYWCDWNVCAEV